jgi:hypothetical protein
VSFLGISFIGAPPKNRYVLFSNGFRARDQRECKGSLSGGLINFFDNREIEFSFKNDSCFGLGTLYPRVVERLV